jgi:3-oxoacyl-[acyl-carrier protein] reductase
VKHAAVVTGASRGIGRATALALARRGLDLALLGRPSAALDDACRACSDAGVTVVPFHCDLAEVGAIETAARSLLERFGAPFVVVNNAGTLVRGPRVHEIDLADWDRVLAVNLRAPFVLCRALLPAMLAAGRGRFVHVASVSATIGCPHMAAYGASKWGLLGFSKSLAEELRGSGLSSVAVLPGSVDTDMLKSTPFPPDMPPDDVAKTIVFCALDAPDAMNGAAVELFA